jgi:hypothetical protein
LPNLINDPFADEILFFLPGTGFSEEYSFFFGVCICSLTHEVVHVRDLLLKKALL